MQFTVPTDHPCLPGHFPGRPLVPGVVILDRVIEAIEAAGAPRDAAWHWPRLKFLQPLLPGQWASIELERMEEADAPTGTSTCRWRFRVLHDEVLLAAGELRAARA